MKPRAATPVRLASASLRASNDQGARLRSRPANGQSPASRPSVTRARQLEAAPFDPMEIAQ